MTNSPDSETPRTPGSRARQGGTAKALTPAHSDPGHGGPGVDTTRTAVPPTFAPSAAGARPESRGARPVGRDLAPPGNLPPRNPAPRTTAPPVTRSPTPRSSRDARPAGPSAAGGTPPPASRALSPGSGLGTPRTRAAVRRRRAVAVALLGIVLLLAWPIGLLIWSNGKIQHVEALSDAPGTPGRVYLLAGSDSRADGAVSDATAGQRTDTIMLLTLPSKGTASLISLPRDTFVDIPGYGPGKLNASFSHGGAPLLVQTVEQLTGMKVDNYVEVGMGGVASLVDAVGGVELCLDYDVDDENSQLRWTAGCHVVDGTTALAFARMRYSDPLGDLGRAQRQQQLISAVSRRVATPSTLLSPARQVHLIRAGTGALVLDEASGVIDLARLALAFRAATGPEGARGTPPIADNDYRPGGLGSTVLLDEAALPSFFAQVAGGTLAPTASPTEAPPS